MYHRVTEKVSGVAAPTCNVTPSQLHHQLSGLLARGFQPWPLSKLVRCSERGDAVPSNAFAVTFDDGYENNYLKALPILLELKIPATIFLPTAFLDTTSPFPFDTWKAAGSSKVPASAWRPLSTSQCHELLASGLIEFGAHTHSHQNFVGRRDEFCRDLEICLQTLKNRFGIERPTFAFPYGVYSNQLVHAATELGVSRCFSTRSEPVRTAKPSLLWGRFGVQASDTSAVLIAKLGGSYTRVLTSGKALARPFCSLVGNIRARSVVSQTNLSTSTFAMSMMSDL
jgi:peptidoglycan/xylan/chitin deacetylase (PgdA/CDA1 family)